MDLLQEIELLKKAVGDPDRVATLVRHDILGPLLDAAEAHLQPDLFAVPHQKKSRTSSEAAAGWRPKAKSAAMKVLREVSFWSRDAFHNSGVTREELCRRTGMKESTACGRLKVLQNHGLIKVDGTRKASSGFNVNVYYITQKGRDFLAREAA